MSSAVNTLESRYDEMSAEDGSVGSDRPVRGIVHCVSSDFSEGGDSSPLWALSFSSNVLGSTRSGSGGLRSGLEFVKRSRSNLQMALMHSRSTTTRQRIFSPRLFAAISDSNSVYCMT